MSSDQKPPNDSEYRVGKGCPPRSTQYKKGESGNLSGRPKDSRSFGTIIAKLLKKRFPAPNGGKARTISGLEYLAWILFKKASTGDLKAIQCIIALVETLAKGQRGTTKIDFSEISAVEASKVYQRLMSGEE